MSTKHYVIEKRADHKGYGPAEKGRTLSKSDLGLV